jgi:hypothetical protein
MDGNYYFSDSSYWYNFNGDIIMKFASDLLDEFCVEAGFLDWEQVPQNEESPYYGDYVVRFIDKGD